MVRTNARTARALLLSFLLPAMLAAGFLVRLPVGTSAALTAGPGATAGVVAKSAESSSTAATGSVTVSTKRPIAVPAVRGTSAFLVDACDGRVIYAKDPDTRCAIASTTKIMTALLASETLPLKKRVKVSAQACQAGESEMWLEPGEERTVEELLYGLLVKSANDAAVALAEASAGSLPAFVQAMNDRAAQLGLRNTHFTNPHGLDGKQHYSSARDLATLGRHAMQNPDFRRLVSTQEVKIPWPGKTYPRVLRNHNELLGKVPFVTGIKTGFTGKAGFCLVGSGEKDGVQLISVILGGQEKGAVWKDTADLLSYGFSKYQQLVLTERAAPVASLSVPYHYGEALELVTERRLVLTVYQDDQVASSVSLKGDLVLPVRAGDVLGRVDYTVGGRPVGQVNLVAARSFDRPTLGVKLKYLWDRFFYWFKDVI